MRYEIGSNGRLKLMPDGVDDVEMLDRLYRDFRGSNPDGVTEVSTYQDKIVTSLELQAVGVQVMNSTEKRIGLGPWGR